MYTTQQTSSQRNAQNCAMTMQSSLLSKEAAQAGLKSQICVAVSCLSLVFFVLVLCFANKFYHPSTATNHALVLVSSSEASVFEACAGTEDFSCDEPHGCFTYQNDIEQVMVGMVRNWDGFSEYMLDQTGIAVDEDTCFETFLKENKMQCVDDCEEGGYLVQSKMNLCKNTFMDQMKSLLMPYRRSCIAGVLSHEMAKMCGRLDDTAGTIEKTAFLWWKDKYAVSDSWTHEQCPEAS